MYIDVCIALNTQARTHTVRNAITLICMRFTLFFLLQRRKKTHVCTCTIAFTGCPGASDTFYMWNRLKNNFSLLYRCCSAKLSTSSGIKIQYNGTKIRRTSHNGSYTTCFGKFSKQFIRRIANVSIAGTNTGTRTATHMRNLTGPLKDIKITCINCFRKIFSINCVCKTAFRR